MKKWQRITLISFSMVFMTLYSVNIIAEAKKKLPYFPNKYAMKKTVQN
jgi:hypothetical protein